MYNYLCAGYTYGPKHGRMLELFIDDLHLPLRHTASVPGSVCPPHEVSVPYSAT